MRRWMIGEASERFPMRICVSVISVLFYGVSFLAQALRCTILASNGWSYARMEHLVAISNFILGDALPADPASPLSCCR